MVADTRALAREEGSVLLGDIHDICSGDREIKDGEEALPHKKT